MKITILFMLFSILFSSLSAQPSLEYVQVFTGLSDPVDIENAGDGSDRLFIVEQDGIIKIVENGSILATPFLDIDALVNSVANERGLLGVAFHPNYESNGFFFVNYTNNSGTTTIARYKVSEGNPNQADPSSAKIMITIPQPSNNHNAGDLAFSPVDSLLYIPMGDGGGANDPQCRSQDSTLLLGKILRIDVDQNVDTAPYYGIPQDNPYTSDENVPDEIWAFGLRNPWKFCFDALTGDMWIADVGQGEFEEVNFQPANSSGGKNYGWAIMEGNDCFDSDPINSNCPNGMPSCFSNLYTDPIFEYEHDFTTGGFSITGGHMYRGCKYSELYGYYIATDYLSANTWVIDQSGIAIQMIDTPSNVSTFGVNESGEMYLATLNGSIYEVRETTFPEVLILTSSDSPLDGDYTAADSIIIEANVTINPNASILFTCPNLAISDDVNLPITASIKVNRGVCDD